MVDLVEIEQVGGVFDEVDDVVDLLRQLVDVLPIERGDVLGVRSTMICSVRRSPSVSRRLISAWLTSA
jgi:hypothetical protein